MFKGHKIKLKSQAKKNCLLITTESLVREVYDDLMFYDNFHFVVIKIDSSTTSIEKMSRSIELYSYVLIDNTINLSLSESIIKFLSTHKAKGAKVINLTSFYEYITGRIPLLHIEKGWLINSDIFFAPRNKHLLFFKRSFDVGLCLIFAPLVMLLMLFGMLLIKLSSKGPVMFKQSRVGQNGKIFTIYKLRTMHYDSSIKNTSFTIKNDKRIFPAGKFLRKSKIDELPQIWNVLKGEMSIIGPRPERSDIVREMNSINPYYNLRHLIRPGISGWAQVNNPTATPEENLQKLEFDLYYIKNMSYMLEFKIILRTIKTVLSGDSL